MANAAKTVIGLRLRLYVTGSSPNSVLALRNARAICDEHFADAYELEIVDLLVHPLRASDDAVIVTPTLIKLDPRPTQRIIGTLEDAASVLSVLAGR